MSTIGLAKLAELPAVVRALQTRVEARESKHSHTNVEEQADVDEAARILH